MNKTDLIARLAERLEGDKKAAAAAVEGIIDIVQREVQKGGTVSLSGFGVFEKRARAARTARNPRTGEPVRVRKTNVPAFRPGKFFKDVVSGAVKLTRAPKAAAKPAARAAATKATAKPAAKPAAKAAAPKATATRAVKAAAKPAARTTRAAAKPTAKAVVKTVAKPAAKPAARKTVAKPAAKPAVRKTVAKPAAKPAARKAAKKK